jgi:hypothetical protein
MGGLLQHLMGKTLFRPLARFVVGLIAIPLFRLFMRRVVRLQELDAELEKDLEQWFRASLVLLVATRNMEETLFGWFQIGDEWSWILMGLRIMLAIGVVELMPDQDLFAIIHPGPAKVEWTRQGMRKLWATRWQFCKGFICKHLNRSSPVFAIMAAIAPGRVGWACYLLAITQYLIIGLVTSRDKAIDVMSEFDRQVAERRRELAEEFDVAKQPEPTSPATETRADVANQPSAEYVSE